MQQRILSRSYGWNTLLPITLILAGAGITAFGLAADYVIGGPSGIGPNQVSLAMSGFAILFAGVVLIASASWRYIGEWLLVISAAFAVAFASDLIVINGLPEFAAKHVLLAASGFSLLLTAAVPFISDGKRTFSEWINWLTAQKTQVFQFLSVALQLGLLVLVMREFQLENQAFYVNIALVAFYGFLIHYFLPDHYRMPFFLLISVAAILGILGLAPGAWLLAVGLGLIGIAHLPVAYPVRLGILLATAALLVALRVQWLKAPVLDVIWPVLASMFMFRLIIYVYDLQHGKTAPTVASTLSYFFLLPNVVFPFFPVVDYSTFRRTYYNEEQHQIYQKGLQWIFRGMLQLIIYRYINYYLMIAPQEVSNSLDMVRYMILNFGLYLRISGQFHVIIGMLHLFGFNLPETHHLYFLATSFTDLWRRINIYWTGFMMKVFYYPIYFKIKHWGATTSLVVATCIVFILTWFFHAYQWFWLRGSFLLTAQDIVFWLILATLVVLNTLYDTKYPRKRTLGQRTWSARDIAVQTLQSAGTFSVMALLWSLWSSDSIPAWFGLLSVVQPTLESVGVILLTFLAITAVFGVVTWYGAQTESAAKSTSFYRAVAMNGAGILALLLIGLPAVYGRIGGKTQALMSDLTVSRLSDREAAMLQQGYYEDLTGVNKFNSGLWEIYSKRPSNWVQIRDTAVMRNTTDNLIMELVPSTEIDFNGTHMTTNRWGMRDRDYELVPAPQTYRIALTGPSFVMGYGVNDGEDFDELLENRLNEENDGSPYAKFEILNFAVPGYSAVQNLIVLEQKAMPFQPNAIFLMAHQREEDAVVMYVADRIALRVEQPYPELAEIAQRAGTEPGMNKDEAIRILRPYGRELLMATYRSLVEVARANDILPVWIFMPTLEDPLHPEEITYLTDIASEAGFVVINLSDAYDNQDPDSLVIAYWDKHPNAKGHMLIADDLYRKLLEQKEEIPFLE